MPLEPSRPSQPSISGQIAIASTFPCEALQPVLEFWMELLGFNLRPELAPFNQVLQQLLDPQSLLNQNKSGCNVVAVRAGDLDGEEFADALRAHVNLASVPVIVCFCPSPTPEPSFQIPLVQLISSSDFNSIFGVRDWEFRNHELETFSYNTSFFTAFGSLLARKIHAVRVPPRKAIILDCDQTLWRGVCAEDSEVHIDPPFQALQQFMLDQRAAGALLCLCSKNRESDVLRILETHPKMLLRREHFTAMRVNWQSKAENIRALAADLKIASDSIIFLDDDAVECAEIAAALPEVSVLRLPENLENFPAFLNQTWAFDRLAPTAEDKIRANFYAQNSDRETLQKSAPSLEEFLAKLDLQVQIRPIRPSDYARVSQLTQRTTQFNFTTIHRSEAELKSFLESGRKEGLIARVRDRFGDYGDVGVVLFEFGKNELKIDTFLLSCRALGRGVEHRIWNHLAEIARSRGSAWIETHYIPTARNEPAHKFLESTFVEKNSAAESSAFRVPASLTVTPKHSAPPQRASSPVAAPQGPAQVDYQRIATELCDLALIVQAIASRAAQSAAHGPELRKVEDALRSHPDIRDARVKLIEGNRIALYLTVDRARAPRIGGRPRVVLPNKLAVVEQSRVETQMLFHEMFEQQIYFQNGIAIRDGECVIDAGANIGFFTMYVQAVCPQARIFAFEPAPPIFELLSVNASLYAPRARLFNRGLSDRRGRAVLEFRPHLSGATSYFPSQNSDRTDSEFIINQRLSSQVDGPLISDFTDQLTERGSVTQRFETETVSLSEVFRLEGITKVHLLKVDVEKSEMNVLRGIKPEDWPMIEQVVLEVHTDDLRDQSTAFLERHGFQVVRDQPAERSGTGLSYVYATRPGHPKTTLPPIPARSFGPSLLNVGEIRAYVKSKCRNLTARLDVVFLDEIPADLPDVNIHNADLDKPLRAPENPLQIEMADIWKTLLGINEVGIDENFFDLGGHSLLAAALLSRAQNSFGVELPLASVFEAPTIAALTEKVERALIAQMDESDLREAVSGK